MFEEYLSKYETKGIFNFILGESFKEKCNAPIDKGGVYLIYKIEKAEERLIYIGSSGQKNLDGTLKIRKGGMKERLVNGYHPNKFGQTKRIKRKNEFPIQMQKQNISELRIYWWVTYDNNNCDFPTEVEKDLRNKYLNEFNKMPEWHN